MEPKHVIFSKEVWANTVTALIAIGVLVVPLGPLVCQFETPELKHIHDLWIEGSGKITEASERLKKLLPAEAKVATE